jgi:toxin ParE1/3/4
MARVELAAGVGDDLDRIYDHLADHLAETGAENIQSRLRTIIEAIAVLEQSPFIGRPAENDMRELIMGRRTSGYVALYRYVVELDTVFVLAIRGQREAGYKF